MKNKHTSGTWNDDSDFLICNIEHNKTEIQKRKNSIKSLREALDGNHGQFMGQDSEIYIEKFERQINHLIDDNNEMLAELKKRRRG